MCDPVTIAGLALTGISEGLNYAAQSKAQSARDDAMAAERIRQNKYDQESMAVNAKDQNSFKDFQGEQGDRAAALSEYFTGQDVPEPAAAQAVPQSSSNITVQEESKQRGNAKAFTDRTGEALGELRSFGDLLGEKGRMQARDAGLIGQIGGFKRGSSNVLPYELDAASHAGDGLGVLADIAGGLGSVGMNAGLSGGNLFGLGLGQGVPKKGTPIPVPTARPMDLTSGSSLFNLYGR